MFDAGRDKDTVCALSTAAGVGGISVIRVSGDQSEKALRKLCPFLPDQLKTHTIYFGTLKSADHREAIDEVLVSYFEDGRSYTGETTFEISSHGSPAISQAIVDELVLCGCRVADRGEFTFRAFMNGRIDLVQAEGVLSLVESQSKPAARLALRQLKGHLSEKLKTIEEDLMWLIARLEVSIDFSTEDVVVAPKLDLLSRIGRGLTNTQALLATFEQGRLLREGLQISLVGQPNVGKSSLLNAILGEERAIVTDIPGTTRDTVEGRKRLAGFQMTFVDTAGLRDTSDPVEKIGVQRALGAASESDFIFFVFDAREEFEESVLRPFAKDKIILIANKADLLDERQRAKISENLKKNSARGFIVSSKTKAGLPDLENFLSNHVLGRLSEDSEVVIQSRHRALLERVKARLEITKGLVENGSSEEFLAIELSDALRAVHEILGIEIDEQIIDRVFRDFCIGK